METDQQEMQKGICLKLWNVFCFVEDLLKKMFVDHTVKESLLQFDEIKEKICEEYKTKEEEVCPNDCII